MIILPKLAIVEMPRTGSTWVRQAIRAQFPGDEIQFHDQHGLLKDLRGLVGDRKTYVQMREQKDWLRSVWWYAQEHEGAESIRKWNRPVFKSLAAIMVACEDMEEFLGQAYGSSTVHRIIQQYRQGVDVVGFTEHCANSLARGLEYAGHEAQPKLWPREKVNASRQSLTGQTSLSDAE